MTEAGTPDHSLAAPAVPEVPGDGDEAVLTLLSAHFGFQAATEAAGRVRLPSLTDFLD